MLCWLVVWFYRTTETVMLGLDVDGRHDEGRMWAVLRFFCPPPLQPVGGGGGKENQPSPAQSWLRGEGNKANANTEDYSGRQWRAGTLQSLFRTISSGLGWGDRTGGSADRPASAANSRLTDQRRVRAMRRGSRSKKAAAEVTSRWRA